MYFDKITNIISKIVMELKEQSLSNFHDGISTEPFKLVRFEISSLTVNGKLKTTLSRKWIN